MIKINELRIGNYLSLMGEPFQVSEIRNSLQEVELCRKNSKNKNLNDYEESDLDHYDLQPIPLSKEWFLKSGFKENKHGTLILKLELDRSFEIIESQDGFYCELVQLPELSSENLMFITLRRIDFVHELQNLYFSLKCEELVFSSTEP